MDISVEGLLDNIGKMLKWYNSTIRATNLNHLPEGERQGYSTPEEYITDLRARLTLPSWYVMEYIAEYGIEVQKLSIRAREVQASKQLDYQKHAQTEEGGEYSKSQSETIGRKLTEVDEEYNELRERLGETEVMLEQLKNVKWLLQQTSNTMAAYNPHRSFEG